MFLQIPSFGNEVFDQESQNESLGIKGELKRTTKDPKDGHSKNVILICSIYVFCRCIVYNIYNTICFCKDDNPKKATCTCFPSQRHGSTMVAAF